MYNNNNTTTINNNNPNVNGNQNTFNGGGSAGGGSGGSGNFVENQFTEFAYENGSLEVLIIDNGDDDRDGYVELSAATKLLAPLVTIRNFSEAVLWANTVASQKMTRRNKNFVHVFAVARYLAGYNLSASNRPVQYYIMKRLISDLILGAQSQILDPLFEIKNQLCTLQECISAGNNQIYSIDPTTEPIVSSTSTYDTNKLDEIRDSLRSDFALILETLKSVHMDLTSKLAFGNDTMLDTFKSLKDLLTRKKNI
uniref:Protein p24 n=1 Tax=Lymantria dispar multicapsid nuclear polyhedrosis virus TaxID=10449 RepID=A0A1B1MR07_NPVLD|nr:protein p24 [Lymantria dispar multiple nucleopolyhedrovirus]